MTAYCTTADLLTGNIPTPVALSPQKFVDDAAEEIDSYVGRRYATPVSLSTSDPLQRPGALLLKRINSHLATGRLILAVDAGGEDKQLHAYGLYLVQESLEALSAIMSGDVILDGAAPVPGDSDGQNTNAPLIYNKDETSQVDDFYDMVTTPFSAANYVNPYGRYGY